MTKADTAGAGLSELGLEIKRRGWNRRATGRVLLELTVHLILAVGGIAVLLVTDTWWVAACAMLVSTAGSMGVGTNTHTSTHHGTSDKKWVNQLLSYLGYPLFLGLSATYWHYMHLVRHHPDPNVLG